jgi:sec-independent protein translocase protein TatA
VFPGSIGPLEVILVLGIALVVLGPKKLPEVGRSIGNGMREFRESLSGTRHRDDDDDAEADADELPPGSTA